MNRNQKILAVVAALIIALYVTGASISIQGGSGDDTSDPTQHPLVRKLGSWFGGADAVTLEEVSGPCLANGKLTIEGFCVVTVAPSDKDVRELHLKSDYAIHLKARAPHDEEVLEDDFDALEEFKVAVDDKGGDITLTCDKCVVEVGGQNG